MLIQLTAWFYVWVCLFVCILSVGPAQPIPSVRRHALRESLVTMPRAEDWTLFCGANLPHRRS
jgi:hypothetical protein